MTHQHEDSAAGGGAFEYRANGLDTSKDSTTPREIKGFIPTSFLPTQARPQRVKGGIERGYRFRWRRAR